MSVAREIFGHVDSALSSLSGTTTRVGSRLSTADEVRTVQ